MPFGLAATRRAVEAAAAAAGCPGRTALRQGKDGHAFVTDGGHWILDAALGRIADPKSLAGRLVADSRASSSTVSLSGWRKPPYSPARPAFASSSGRDRSDPSSQGVMPP